MGTWVFAGADVAVVPGAVSCRMISNLEKGFSSDRKGGEETEERETKLIPQQQL